MGMPTLRTYLGTAITFSLPALKNMPFSQIDPSGRMKDPSPTFTISCTGQDGVCRNFTLCISQDRLGGLAINVHTIPEQQSGISFEITLKPTGPNEYRQTEIFHHIVDGYKAKGIPDTAIPFLCQNFSISIESSPSSTQGNAHSRTGAATKMWDRLVAKGLARYSPDRDVYHVV
jgi:hypothetical protein